MLNSMKFLEMDIICAIKKFNLTDFELLFATFSLLLKRQKINFALNKFLL